MKRFLIFLLVSALISAGLTFVFFAEKPVPPDPIRAEYAEVFTRFGLHAEEAYRQFDDASGLDILATYDAEGLSILLQYKDLILQLQPHLDPETLISLCRTDGDLLTAFLTIFQPDTVADIYNRFGLQGLRYVLDDPERYFLLQTHGTALLELANRKGPLMFDLIKVYSPEFLELYYDDALFNAIRHLGLDGLLAIQTYRGMANTIFSLFSAEPQFAAVLRQYGYQQVIPVLYYFYQHPDPQSWQERLAALDLAQPFQEEPSEEFPDTPDTPTGEALSPQDAHIRVQWALQQIATHGNNFLRQFTIDRDGTVTPLPLLAFTNFLEDVLLGEAPYFSPALRLDQTTAQTEPDDCQHLHAVLDILGLLSPETVLHRQMRCTYLRSAIASVRSREGLEGLLALDEEQELVDRYGPAVVPFLSQYGQKGLQLLRQTDGAILPFMQVHGQELVEYALDYGPDLLVLVEEFGNQLIETMRATQGEIFPYVKPYGKGVLQLVKHPQGRALLGLAAVLGESVVNYSLQYPDDFPRVLFKYGRTSILAIRRYDGEILAHARHYGDDAIYYAGRFGEEALALIRLGMPGITLLRVMPDTRLENPRFLGQPFLKIMFDLLLTSPRTVHTYIGALGHHYIHLTPTYSQALFWMLVSLCVLTVLGWIYTLLKRLLIG